MTDRPRVLLGEVGAAHGLRGEVTIRSFTAEPTDIVSYGPLESFSGAALPALSVVRATPKGLICRFQGITDRTAVEKLRGTQLWLSRERLPPPAPGDYYHADLIGLAAVSPDGSKLGTVIAVVNFGAGDLLEVQQASGGGSEYVPFTNACVPEVDLDGGKVVIVMPEMVEADDDDGSEDPPASAEP